MGKEETEKFHEQLIKILLPYLSKYSFQIDHKRIDERIGAYAIVLKSNNRCISLSFCMHHYDLFNGTKVNLYYENDSDNTMTLNEMGSGDNKIYFQLDPENSLKEIVKDLQAYCEDFLKPDR